MTPYQKHTTGPRRVLYPEVQAGGFTGIDHSIQFFSRLNAVLSKDAVLLDLGAGRGRMHIEEPIPWRRELQSYHKRCAKVIGADVDPVVMDNPSLDEAHLIKEDGRISIPDASVDLVFSDFTFEHVDDPKTFCAEIDRVLKPGGWLCARTPNKWGYISLGANLIPNRLHVAVLRYLQPGRKAEDVFPTRYRLNTMKSLRQFFPPEKWTHASYYWSGEPAYFGGNLLAWRLAISMNWLFPKFMSPLLLIFIQKHHTGSTSKLQP